MGAVLGIIIFLATIARTEHLADPEDLLAEVDMASLEQVIADNLPPESELPNAEDWQSFWYQVEAILQSQSLDDMTWFRSTVQQACGYLDADPATKPWADWLRQRLDYFEMASVAVHEVPSEPAVPIANVPSTPSSISPAMPAAKPGSLPPPWPGE